MVPTKFFQYVFFILAFSSGVLFQKYIGIWKIKEIVLDLPEHKLSREEVRFQEIDKSRLMVALAFGQSNSANYGSQLNSANNNVYNFYQGSLYKARDPMLGADGKGGSVWPILGDMLVNNDRFSAVIFATIGVSGSEISQWTTEGDLYQRLAEMVESLHENGYEITHLLWHQGETDAVNNTPQEQYISHFVSMKNSIRSLGVNAPFYVSIASHNKDEALDNKIRNAQKQIISEYPDVLSGPDTDQLGNEYRYDDTHFSMKGMRKVAQMWFQILLKID